MNFISFKNAQIIFTSIKIGSQAGGKERKTSNIILKKHTSSLTLSVEGSAWSTGTGLVPVPPRIISEDCSEREQWHQGLIRHRLGSVALKAHHLVPDIVLEGNAWSTGTGLVLYHQGSSLRTVLRGNSGIRV